MVKSDGFTHFSMGMNYYESEQYDSATQHSGKAIKLNTNLAETFNNRGLDYLYSARFDNAVQDFDRDSAAAIFNFNKAIELNPNYAEAYYNRGLTYHGWENYETAIKDFDKVIELDPNFAGAYFYRGICYEELEDEEKAQADYAKAKELGYEE